MSKDNGFLQLRRGVFEHVRDGRLTHSEALAFIYILTQADTRSGIWIGSAGALAGELGFKPRHARDIIERLTAGAYLVRFPIPGKHCCYPILVHKFQITDGEHRGEHLNALLSESPVDLRYFSREQSVELDGEHNVKQRPSQKRSKNREVRRTPAAKTAAPPDSRFQPIVNHYFEGMKKEGIEPNADASDFGALSAWLKKSLRRPLEGILASLSNAFGSTDPYPLRPGFRLREFVQHESKYQLAPLLRKVTPIQIQPLKSTRLASGTPGDVSENARRKLQEYGVKGVAC